MDVIMQLEEMMATANRNRKLSETAKDWLWEAAYKGQSHAYAQAIAVIRDANNKPASSP